MFCRSLENFVSVFNVLYICMIFNFNGLEIYVYGLSHNNLQMWIISFGAPKTHVKQKLEQERKVKSMRLLDKAIYLEAPKNE